MAGVRQPHWAQMVTDHPSSGSAAPPVIPKFKPLSTCPPDLVQIRSSRSEHASSGEKEFGVGPAEFLHSLQLQIFLKKATSGQPTPLPVLKNPATSCDVEADDLSRDDVLKLIRRVVVMTSVDCGYECASESCLDLLTETCGKFIQRICADLSSHQLSQRLSSVTGEHHLYQMLDQIGFSVPTLHHFVKGMSERKQERLVRVSRIHGHVADNTRKAVVLKKDPPSGICNMIAGLGEETVPLSEEKIWDESLDQMSEMSDEQIIQSLAH